MAQEGVFAAPASAAQVGAQAGIPSAHKPPADGSPAAAPPAPAAFALDALLAGRQGTLLLAYARETALLWLAACGERVDLAFGSADDPRCFHTLLLQPDAAALRGPWRDAVLLDGPLCGATVVQLRRALPQARIHVLPPSPPLRAAAAAIDAGDEAYRALYRLLRRGAYAGLAALSREAGLSQAQTLCGLWAFASLGFISFTETPFHYAFGEPEKCSLGQSPVLGALRALRA